MLRVGGCYNDESPQRRDAKHGPGQSMSLRKQIKESRRLDDAELRERLDYDDAALLAECEVHTFRASGPGGQKRNKTSSAVRLLHRASGLIAIGKESRSQYENKARALRRLREEIAVETRVPPVEPVCWPDNVSIVRGRLEVSAKNPSVFHVIALVLDALATSRGRLADAAQALGISSSSLTRFLSDHNKVWGRANRIRADAGLAPLRQ